MNQGQQPLSREEQYLRTRFLGALAHAIRSPLSVASGALDELGAASRDEGSMFVEIARRNLRRLHALADSLNRVADIESGAVSARLAPCDVTSIVRQVADVGEHPRRRDKVAVALEVEQSPLTARADPELLMAALAQIVDNGVRFARSRICIRAGQDADSVWIEVEDDGAGIDPERREQVFDRYTSARERGADTDLAFGLSLARDYLDMQGGQVRLSSARSGAGTCCRVELQRAGPG